MAEITIIENGKIKTINSDLTSTCLEEKKTGEKFFQLVFNNVRLSFSEIEFEQFRIILGEFYAENQEEDGFYDSEFEDEGY